MADDTAVTQIISSHVSELSGSDAAPDVESGADEAASGAVDTTQPAVAETAPEQAQAEQPDELLTNEFKGNKFNRLPYNRVKAIVENARKKAAEEHAAKLAEHQTKLQQFETESQTWRQQQDELRQLAANPETFLRSLAQVNPAYADIVARAFAQQEAREQAQPQSAAVEPDVVLPDGTFGYSAAAAQRLYQQRLAEAEKQLEAKLAKRFEPIENEYRARKQYEEIVPRVRQQLAEAQKWPLFSEHQDAIRKAMEGNRSLSLESAYRQIVFPKLQADRDKMRAEILAEINAKPKAASAPQAPAQVPVSSKDRSVDAIIRDAIRANS